MSDKTINEYIEDLKNGKDTAERSYKMRKSIMERAAASYSKAASVEASLKDYCDRISNTDRAATAIDTALLNAVKTGDAVLGNTDKARQSVELLTYEVQDIACQSEMLVQQIKDFRKAVEDKIGKDKPALGCIDEVLKTLPDVSTHAFAGLDKTLGVIKTINFVQSSIAGNCGINARLLELTATIKKCGFKDEISAEEDAFSKIYTCNIPSAAGIADPKCGTFYSEYLNKTAVGCDRDFEKNFGGYRNKAKTNYQDAASKSAAALAWLNCTTAEKNAAEASFNACKAAYEAALAAKKC